MFSKAGGNEISFCGNTVFLKSPAWEQNLAVQAGGAVAASHAHINTDFSFLFSSEPEIDIFCVGLDWKKKKKFHDQSYPFPWTVLAALEWILFLREPFIHTLIYRHTPNAKTIRKIFIFTRQQAVLVAMAFVSIALPYNLLQTLHFYKTYSRFNPTIATFFFFFLLAKCVMVIVLTKLSWAMLTLLFMD